MPKRDVLQSTPVDPLAHALEWDWGTAYDFLLSVHTIFNPKEHGLPAPWAAGVRKRLSPRSQRDFKEFFGPTFSLLTYTPLHLVLEMNPPKDAPHLLEYVASVADDKFCRRLRVPVINDKDLDRLMTRAMNGESLGDADIEEYRRVAARVRLRPAPGVAEVRTLLDEMADPAGTKKRWLDVMREYYDAFFAEEEKRERPVLEQALHRAQDLSGAMPVNELIERLSNGFTLSEDIDLKRLILVPSLWCHPFVVNYYLRDRELFVAWGERPPGYRLVPGESVPDEALLVLRALGDPTRLRLLRLIAAEPRSLQSLANEVRLSLPTVSHHMRELRVAGLVRLEVAGSERESNYTVRWPSARRAFRQLEQFVLPDEPASE